MNSGRKSHVVRMHNAGVDPEEIAERVGEHPSVVKAFLRRRPGWPGKIISPTRAPRVQTPEGARVNTERRVPSLPKLRFMGEV